MTGEISTYPTEFLVPVGNVQGIPACVPSSSSKSPKASDTGAGSKSRARGARGPQLRNAQTYGVTEANLVFLWLTDVPRWLRKRGILRDLRKRGIEGAFWSFQRHPPLGHSQPQDYWHTGLVTSLLRSRKGRGLEPCKACSSIHGLYPQR